MLLLMIWRIGFGRWAVRLISMMRPGIGSGKPIRIAWVYSYDGENRLTQVTKNGTDVLDNNYDGSGMRVKDVKNGQTTYYVFQGNNPLMEYSLSDSKYKYLIYAGNKLIAEEKDG